MVRTLLKMHSLSPDNFHGQSHSEDIEGGWRLVIQTEFLVVVAYIALGTNTSRTVQL